MSLQNYKNELKKLCYNKSIALKCLKIACEQHDEKEINSCLEDLALIKNQMLNLFLSI